MVDKNKPYHFFKYAETELEKLEWLRFHDYITKKQYRSMKGLNYSLEKNKQIFRSFFKNVERRYVALYNRVNNTNIDFTFFPIVYKGIKDYKEDMYTFKDGALEILRSRISGVCVLSDDGTRNSTPFEMKLRFRSTVSETIKNYPELTNHLYSLIDNLDDYPDGLDMIRQFNVKI